MAWKYLRWLHLGDHARALTFLQRLLDRFPRLLDTEEGVQLMALVQHWVPPEQAYEWLERMGQAGPLGAQGFGEVLMVRRVLFPTEEWPRQRIEILLAGDEEDLGLQRVGLAHAVVELWSDPAHRNLSHGYLIPLLATEEEPVVRALSGIFLKNCWPADRMTWGLMDAICDHPAVLRFHAAEYVGELLLTLVDIEPQHVARLCHTLLNQGGEAMRDMGTRWYLTAEPLSDIALLLQDMEEPHRQAGIDLFERMLEFNLPQASDVALSLDNRMPNITGYRPRRRLRRQRRPPSRR